MSFTFRLWLNKWSLLRLSFLGWLYLVALFVFVAVHTRHPSAFNSDDLYCPSVCEDLLRGRDMHGWHFSAVPYLFPDLTLLLPCVALSSNLVVVFLAYNFLFYNLFGIVLAWIFGMVQIGVTLAPARIVAGNHWYHRRSARIGHLRMSRKCYPKQAHFEPCRIFRLTGRLATGHRHLLR